MPVYMNGQKYIGAYMNGQKVNGYINGVKLFSYLNDPGYHTATGTCDPFPYLDNQYMGGSWTLYSYPGGGAYSNDSGGMGGDTSVMNIDQLYIDYDGSRWYHGPCYTYNSQGAGGQDQTYVGTGWIPGNSVSDLSSTTLE